jgi:hypothetical protein
MPLQQAPALKCEKVLQAIDLINSKDENTTILADKEYPKELLYGHLMTECLMKYWPQANPPLQIAVRAQHIKRWHFKRVDFPAGKAGYYQWRIALGKFHAELASTIMIEEGFSEQEANQTASMIRKENLQLGGDSQTLEDVACLVFLQHYFNDFAAKYTGSIEGEVKIINIVKRTWGKMSHEAHEIALSLTLPAHLSALVEKALSVDG